ncbi:galectin-1-like isoform X3 [Sminthopsis crassicaudata]|uniref:galectin-1-like isoform X3 n=1 Tax=Sminthopsis crassicaudata TaxID=9301 RepID=UPI003D689FB5
MAGDRHKALVLPKDIGETPRSLIPGGDQSASLPSFYPPHSSANLLKLSNHLASLQWSWTLSFRDRAQPQESPEYFSSFIMVKEMMVFNFQVLSGGTIKIEGEIPPDAKQFKLKVGEDYTNIGIQVNPIFNHEGKTKVICYNYMDKSWWGEEEKTTNFPFVPGSRVEISITFNGFGFTAILPKDVQIHVPNRLKLNAATFLQTTGDFKVRKVTFD